LFGGASPRRDDPTETADMAQDPNCGTYVPKRQSVASRFRARSTFFVVKNVLMNTPLKKNKHYKRIEKTLFECSD
jgi:hypothetical protein